MASETAPGVKSQEGKPTSGTPSSTRSAEGKGAPGSKVCDTPEKAEKVDRAEEKEEVEEILQEPTNQQRKNLL